MSGPQGKRGRAGRSPKADPSASGSLYERYKDALRRGHVAALRGRNDAALDAYGEAASIAPDRALPHVSIGGVFTKMDRFDEAATSYQRALDLAPRDEGAMRGLAEVHSRTGRRTAAAAALDRLADILDADGRLADATDAARRALELAESRARRRQVEGFAVRLREASSGDEIAQRALDQALQLLEPTTRESEGTGEPELDAALDESSARVAVDVAPPDEAMEPAGLGIALGAAAEAALHAGDLTAAFDGLLAAARAHRRAGRTVAAVDACYLAIGLVPADPELHLILTELYLDRGWRSQAADKLLLLGRLAELTDDRAVRDRLCALVSERLADEPRVAGLCA